MPEAKECTTGRMYIVIRAPGTWAMSGFSPSPGSLRDYCGAFIREDR